MADHCNLRMGVACLFAGAFGGIMGGLSGTAIALSQVSLANAELSAIGAPVGMFSAGLLLFFAGIDTTTSLRCLMRLANSFFLGCIVSGVAIFTFVSAMAAC